VARAVAFIFDLDGTLVDSGRDIAASANHVRRCLDLPTLPEAVARSYVGDGVVRLLERTLGHDSTTGLTGAEGRLFAPDELERGLALFRTHYAEHLLDTTVPYSGAAGVLDALAAVPLLVATNKPRGFTDRILAGTGLAGRFARIVGGDEVAARKPDPGHLAAAVAGLELDPARVVMVGDSPNDVQAARAFGCVSVGCTYGLVPPEIVTAAGPDHVLDALAGLPGLFPGLELGRAPSN
jgi:phosphoglycolate phosphatase